MDLKKIIGRTTFPLAIITSALVLAIGFYAVQYNKQQSIEKQQLLQLQQARKADCLDVYKAESDKWNNVHTWRYSKSDDVCSIFYKHLSPKSDTECDEIYGDLNLYEKTLCKNGKFVRRF